MIRECGMECYLDPKVYDYSNPKKQVYLEEQQSLRSNSPCWVHWESQWMQISSTKLKDLKKLALTLPKKGKDT